MADPRLALIVDDSRTAAVALSKMLARRGVEVVAVESGEAGLEYLRDQRPDVIFMDHMMPGMDGFEAVKAIKSDLETASIPIVMYTTQEGDIYVGQAKALGAIDILTKPASDERLDTVLDSVRESTRPRRQAPANGLRGNGSRRPPNASDTMELDAHAVAMAAEMASRISAQQGRAAGSSSGTADSLGITQPAMPVVAVDTPGGFGGTPRQWLVALVFLVPIAWLLYLYLPAQKLIEEQQRHKTALIDTLQWSLNQRDSYDFGEAPLADDMIALLRGLVPQLTRAGFTGTIRLEGHIGEFCLSTVRLDNGAEISMLPEAGLPLTACTMIGYSPAQAARDSVRQTPEFRDYIKSQRLDQASSPIRVDIVAMGARQPKYPYPKDLQGLTTGDWNAIALRNNRIRIALLPGE